MFLGTAISTAVQKLLALLDPSADCGDRSTFRRDQSSVYMAAKEEDGEPPYLSVVPKDLWDTVDLALVVGGTAFPVHSLVVAGQSKVLREALLNCPNTSASGTFNSQRQLPLVGDEIATVTDTLTYLYRRTFAVQPVKLSSVLEAVRVAEFAHKYHCDNLTREADVHLSREAARPQRSQGPLLALPKRPGAGSVEGLVNLKSWDALHFLDMAQKFGLSQFSAHCEHWLISQPRVFENEHLRLGKLPPACLARLARGLAMKILYTPAQPAPAQPVGGAFSSFPASAVAGSQPTLSAVLSWHGLLA